jgi:hypothetical protein
LEATKDRGVSRALIDTGLSSLWREELKRELSKVLVENRRDPITIGAWAQREPPLYYRLWEVERPCPNPLSVECDQLRGAQQGS